jgi:hypothetical protein
MTPEARETLRRLAENEDCGGTCTSAGCQLARGVLALLDALEAREWRDIETAPKDGTRVLVAYDGRAWGAYFKVGVFGPQWWAENGGILHPTHWQPLPPTPSPEER